MELKFSDIESNQGVVISWENLDVSTKPTFLDKIKSSITRQPKTKSLLSNLRGLVKPGEMVALMGARYAIIFFNLFIAFFISSIFY